jgi:hypothetical protein
MRVCQPGPVAFQRAMVCGGKRNESNCLGLASLGRPRRTSLSPSYMSAPAIQASVISGKASDSREEGTEFFRFAFMTVPHADDASCNAAWRPCENYKPRIEPTNGNESRLAVVFAVIRAGEMRSGKNLSSANQIQSALLQGPIALLGIAGDSHGLIVATQMALSRRRALARPPNA